MFILLLTFKTIEIMEKWIAVLLVVLVILLDSLCLYDSFLTNNVLKISWGFMTYASLIIFNAFAFIFSRVLYKVYKEDKEYKGWLDKQ